MPKKMLSRAQKAMILKDIKEIFKSQQTLLPIIIVPLIMMIVLPAGLVIGAQFGKGSMNDMQPLIDKLGGMGNYANEAQMVMDLGLNYMFPAMFLIIPIMTAVVIGASSFVGEKEHKTLESLLYTPMSLIDLFAAKVIGTAVFAYAIALLSLVAFGIVINIGGFVYFDHLIFPNVKWLILIFWLTPAVTVLGIGFMVLVSAKAKTFQEAQQMSTFIVLPVILLLVGQSTGLIMINTYMLIGVGAALYILDYFLLKNAASSFKPESLVE